MTNRSPLRNRLIGHSLEDDRLWLLHAPTGEVYAITEYNHELTGYDPRLAEIDSVVFQYGGNAYYITGSWASAKGWTVSEHEDRK